MLPLTSCPPPARLQEHLDGTLAKPQQAELMAHLDSCQTCQQTLERLAAGSESLLGMARRVGQESTGPEPALREVLDDWQDRDHAGSIQTEPAHCDDLPLDFLSASEKPGHLGRLGHYEVIEVVGRGGMGVVLKAFDEVLQRIVAIKVMARPFASSATARRRFRREAQAAAAVSHDHVVTTHAVDEANGLPYLVMQYVAGVSLQDRLDHSGPLELKEILRIGMQTANGLAAAHAQGLVHRDIKPANILLENGVERVKITDFGLARAVDDASLSQSGVITGTPQYMAPEQARGETVDHRADLFSLGSILYAMCTGHPPFRASSVMAVLKRVSEDTPRPVREINPDVPDWLCAIIDKLHAKEPDQRFATAQEVADLLGQHLAHLQQPGAVPTPPSVERPPRPQSRKPSHTLPWALAAACVVGLGCCVLSVPVFVMFGRFVVQPEVRPKSVERVEPVWPDEAAPALKAPLAAAQARRFAPPKDTPITQDGVTATADGWKIENTDFPQRTVRLFEVRDLDVKDCRLVLRLQMKTETKEKLENRQIFTRPILAFRPKVLIKTGPTGDTVLAEKWNDLARRGNTSWAQEEVATNCLSQPDVIALNLQVKGIGTIWIKDVELIAIPLPAPKAGGKPFAILSRANRAEQPCPTLAEAVALAKSGDTIEVRGDGPFVTPALDLKGRALTIRASAGFRPTLRLEAQRAQDTRPLFDTDSPLVLEGLVLERQVEGGLPKDPSRATLIRAWWAPIRAANCRFVGKSCIGLYLMEMPRCDLHNCEFLGPDLHCAIDWIPLVPSGNGTLNLENCILLSRFHGLAIHQYHPFKDDAILRLARNTLISDTPLNYWCHAPVRDVLARRTNRAARPLRVEAAENLFDPRSRLLKFWQVDQAEPLDAKEAEAALAKLLAWGGRRNLYSEADRLLLLSWLNKDVVQKPSVSPPDVGNLAQWNRLWGAAETGDREGRAAYAGGDLMAKGRPEPGRLTPSDFRLKPGSPGNGAGKDGRDLGADVDLVGPGSAYERWKKTPAYQQWLKDSGQMKP